MNTLVTGHAGYIGGVLADQLASNGHDVVGFDRAADPADDVRDRERVEAVFEDHEFDVVYHLAADADVWEDDWGYLFENNVAGTVTVVDAARAAGVPVVFASSIAASGSFNRYGHSKNLAEQAVGEYDAVTTIRFPNVVGRAAPRGQVQDMIEEALDGEIEVWGNGKIQRPYVDVRDLCTVLREAGAGSYVVRSSAAIAAHTATNLTVGEYIESVVAEETGSRPSVSVVDREPPSPKTLTAEGLRVRDPRSLEASVRSQVRATLRQR